MEIKDSLFSSEIHISFLFYYLFIFILFVFGHAGYLLLCLGFSLVAVSEGYFLVAVYRLLISVVSLVVEHRLLGT